MVIFFAMNYVCAGWLRHAYIFIFKIFIFLYLKLKFEIGPFYVLKCLHLNFSGMIKNIYGEYVKIGEKNKQRVSFRGFCWSWA